MWKTGKRVFERMGEEKEFCHGKENIKLIDYQKEKTKE